MSKQKQIGDVPGNILGMLADLTHKLQHGNIKVTELERFLKKENPFLPIIYGNDQVLSVTVNQDRSIKEMIKAGQYERIHSEFNNTEWKCIGTGTKTLDVIIVAFHRPMSYDSVLKEFEARNLRPADMRVLLSLGEQHMDKLTSMFPVIALGTWTHIEDRMVHSVSKCVPYIRGDYKQLGFTRYMDEVSVGVEYFAAICK